MEEKELVKNKDKYIDSMEIDLGGTGSRGKIYFDSDDEDEAKKRVSSYFKIAEHKELCLVEFKANKEGKSDAENKK